MVAYDRAEVGALEPFNFVRLVIAALIGYFIFAEIRMLGLGPGERSFVASTTYLAQREAVRRRGDSG